MSNEREISSEEALEKLVDEGDEDFVSLANQDLKNLEFSFHNYKEKRRLMGLKTERVYQDYEKWMIDEALRDMRSALKTWASSNDYDFFVNDLTVWDEPLHEEFLRNISGSMEIDGTTVNYDLQAPNRITIGVEFEGFDRSMKDEYRELEVLTNAVMSNYGSQS